MNESLLEQLARIVLPKELLDYFEIVKIETDESDIDAMSMTIHLDERMNAYLQKSEEYESNGRQKGMAEACLKWCLERCGNIRVDTHHDNHVMQHILQKHGFRRCGIIYTHNGTPRIAYQRTL